MSKVIQNENIRNLYDSSISTRYSNDYEFNRWFTSKRLCSDYIMTYRALGSVLDRSVGESVLELGPGPGTWTRLLHRVNPNAKIMAVDISAAMKSQFELEMRSKEIVDYKVEDFLDIDFDGQNFDTFFSSRAVEYFENKEKLFKKISESMKSGAVGVINTKNPHNFKLAKIFLRNNKQQIQHTGQISQNEMTDYLVNNGMTDIHYYPCIIRIPIIDRLTTVLSEGLFNRHLNKELDKIPAYVESYIVKFKKA